MGNFLMRCNDILFAVLFITVFSWVYIITWVTIHIVSTGPAIYRARRVGLHGKIFTCYKFRSMRVDSGKIKMTTLQNDDRVFGFGKFIRATKIDEMPQAFNILFGDMSIVGPRPAIPREVEQYNDYEKQRLYVTPGLTCYWQIQPCRNDLSFEEWLELDLKYIQDRSFWVDWKIVIKTFGAVLGMNGE